MAMAMDSKGYVRFSKGSGAGEFARTVTIDSTELHRRAAEIKRRFGPAARGGVEQINALIAVRVDETAPRDTNRYVRGWLLACADVGPIPAYIPPLAASSRHQQYLAKLEKEYKRVVKMAQAERRALEFLYLNKPNRNRNTPGFRKLQNKINKLEKWAERLIEEYIKLDGDPSGLLMDAERGGRNYSTVRVGVFGGRGMVTEHSDRVIVSLHNLEPHTTIVEKRYEVMRRAMREVKSLGLSTVAAAIVRRIKKAG